jgi:hypothetical protein
MLQNRSGERCARSVWSELHQLLNAAAVNCVAAVVEDVSAEPGGVMKIFFLPMIAVRCVVLYWPGHKKQPLCRIFVVKNLQKQLTVVPKFPSVDNVHSCESSFMLGVCAFGVFILPITLCVGLSGKKHRI